MIRKIVGYLPSHHRCSLHLDMNIALLQRAKLIILSSGGDEFGTMFTIATLFVLIGVITLCLWQKFKLIDHLKYYLVYIYVWILKRSTPLIFDFDFNSKDIQKFGVTSLPATWLRDSPRDLQPSIHASDTQGFSGVHKDGSVLITRITRRHNRIAETWVYLRLPSGEQYELPNHPDTKIYNVCDKKFSAGGLTFEILEPFRRWRVIFDGYLRKRTLTDWDESDNDMVHVCFNFIWHPMYNYVAFPQDFTCSFLAEILASRPWSKELINPTAVFSEESIEILGYLHGGVKIENKKELILQLRGFKERKHGVCDWNEVDKKLSIKGTLNNGRSFYIFAESNKANRLSYLYGYVLPPCNTRVHHIDTFSVEPKELFLLNNFPQTLLLHFSSGKKNFTLKVTCDKDEFVVREGNQWEKQISVRPVNITLNDKEGKGLIEYVSAYHGYCPVPVQHSLPLLQEPDISESDVLVVSFTDVECRSSKIVGGKGASLANMLTVPNNMYNVPLGVCLTSAAFNMHLNDNPVIMEAILHMQNVAWKKTQGSLSDECDRVINTMNDVTEIPDKVKNQLHLKLKSVFGEDYDKKKFAVRSSAIGEDGDEISAAGQNETFLGILGFNNICSNVLKCWASQFSYRSIEYRRQNGQLLNNGMGVVVQVMVPADVSGVLFSRDPLTGSRTQMLISSNFGLGESVVSASADPDSVILKRTWNDTLTVLKKEVGSKKHMITLAEDGGTVESEVDKDKASTFTIPDKRAIKLGQIAIFQEKCFGNPRDIEWAIQGHKIFLLQSRPVTVDNIVPDFEIMHEFDTSPRTDEERGSTANVGEVMPGSVSPLGFSSTIRSMSCYLMSMMFWKLKTHRFDPFVFDGWLFHYGHSFFDQVQQKSWSLGKKSAVDKAADIALYGRVLDDDDVLEIAVERFEDPPMQAKFTLALMSFKGILFGHWLLKNAIKASENDSGPTIGMKSIKEMYDEIGAYLLKQFDSLGTHMCISFGSSVWNIMVLNLLSGGSDDYTVDQYTDFAKIIGSGIGAESGNVPYSLQKLARTIAQEIDSEKFINWSPEHALQWLQEVSKDSGRKFKKFLARHGHRGVKEVDVMTVTWAMDPLGVIKILQDILRLPQQDCSDQTKSVDDLKGLKTQLTPFRRFLLKLVMKGSHLAICQREKAKSLLVKYVSRLRTGYRHLADMMVAEGFIPDPNLIFFFTLEEIQQLLNTRSAKLIRRAKHRSRLYPKMDAMKFPEMMIGLPVPINEDDDEPVDEITDTVKGYPVSQGVIKGPARVVKSFHEIGTIQPGDILITNSTDIGWSPYFPMLSGVVTEIGGLISHGAVVAREFGLPCIVGAQRATSVFKSGDTVILDANKGILSKVHSTICQIG